MQVATSDLCAGAGGSGPSFRGDKTEDQSWDLLLMTREPLSVGGAGPQGPTLLCLRPPCDRTMACRLKPRLDVTPADCI